MNADDIMEAMKRIEWQRARGHLLAMLETYHSPVDARGNRDSSAYDNMHGTIWRFIAETEDQL